MTVRSLGPAAARRPPGDARRARRRAGAAAVQLAPAPALAPRAAARARRPHLLQVRGQGTEFDSLREYVRGDDVRSIDWRATARNPALPGAGQRLMVRTWRPERDRRVVIVVDSGRTAAARIADEPRLDTAFEAALLLTALATRAGDRVDLLVWDRRVRARVHGAASAEVLHRMVEAMAPVEPELLETDWSRRCPAQIRGAHARSTRFVVLRHLARGRRQRPRAADDAAAAHRAGTPW